MFHEQIKNKSFAISTLTDYNCLIALNNRRSKFPLLKCFCLYSLAQFYRPPLGGAVTSKKLNFHS